MIWSCPPLSWPPRRRRLRLRRFGVTLQVIVAVGAQLSLSTSQHLKGPVSYTQTGVVAKLRPDSILFEELRNPSPSVSSAAAAYNRCCCYKFFNEDILLPHVAWKLKGIPLVFQIGIPLNNAHISVFDGMEN